MYSGVVTSVGANKRANQTERGTHMLHKHSVTDMPHEGGSQGIETRHPSGAVGIDDARETEMC